MYCPRCIQEGIQLVRTDYEGFFVKICPKCHGFLLSPSNLKSIERKQEISETLLKQEAANVKDGELDIHCPKCRMKMKRENAPHGLDFQVDVCKRCNLIWLDPGELEAIQLAYEKSPAGRDVLSRKSKMLNMSEERRARLEANIAKAPDNKVMSEFCDDITDSVVYGSAYGRRGFGGRGNIIEDLFSSFFY